MDGETESAKRKTERAGTAESVPGPGKQSTPKTRTFRFDYGFQVVDLPADARVRVWLPVPPDDQRQTVVELDRKLPCPAKRFKEPKYENSLLFLEPKAPASGQLDFSISYRVKRMEVRSQLTKDAAAKIEPQVRKQFLSATSLVPVDGKPLELLKGQSLPKDEWSLARTLYNRVDEHMKYDKSKPGYGNGDVIWACDSRTGNCTDFHSLFISLARSQGLPSRFSIGFPLPEKRGKGTIGGYHCWADFFVEQHGWVPIDISEADKHPEMKDYYFGNLTENRVVFSRGRDLELVPRQQGKPLNYFVYPHVEVNGKIWPKEKIKLRFRYEDL